MRTLSRRRRVANDASPENEEFLDLTGFGERRLPRTPRVAHRVDDAGMAGPALHDMRAMEVPGNDGNATPPPPAASLPVTAGIDTALARLWQRLRLVRSFGSAGATVARLHRATLLLL